MTISRSSAISMNVFLIFDIHEVNGALFLNVTSFLSLSFSLAAEGKRSVFPLTTIACHYNHTKLILALEF